MNRSKVSASRSCQKVATKQLSTIKETSVYEKIDSFLLYKDDTLNFVSDEDKKKIVHQNCPKFAALEKIDKVKCDIHASYAESMMVRRLQWKNQINSLICEQEAMLKNISDSVCRIRESYPVFLTRQMNKTSTNAINLPSELHRAAIELVASCKILNELHNAYPMQCKFLNHLNSSELKSITQRMERMQKQVLCQLVICKETLTTLCNNNP